MPLQAFGLTFNNPIGLAAGYDKDGLGWRGLACLGYGHIEIGTVTLRPQPGNPRMEATTNLVGGQPFSLENLRAVKKIAAAHGIPLVFDGSLISENAYFIKQREGAYADRSIREILAEMMELVDIFYMSARKSTSVRGGMIATNHKEYYDRVLAWLPVYEGFATYGGMSIKEIEAMAVGLREMTDINVAGISPEFIQYFVGRLEENRMPAVTPPGGLACHVDAKRFLPHIPHVRDATRLAAVAERIERELGEVSAVVAAAGVARVGKFLELTPEELRDTIETNLLGTAFLFRAFVPPMLSRRRGTLVPLLSVAARKAFPAWSAYCASKWGTLGLVEALREELAGSGVRLVALTPAATETPLWDAVAGDWDRARMIPAAEVARALVWALDGGERVAVEEIRLQPPGGNL